MNAKALACLLALLLAGCAGEKGAANTNLDDAGDGGADDGLGGDGPGADDGDGLTPGADLTPDLTFIANTMSGDVPLEVTFDFNATDQGSDAAWALDFGDASDTTGTGLPDTATHVYEVGGVFTATLNVTFAGGQTDERNVTITVTVPDDPGSSTPPPSPTSFTYGPSAGCLTEHGQCHAGGPSATGVLGHWQAFDSRYWGYRATITSGGNVAGDTDCVLLAPNGSTILAEGNNGGGPCSAIIPAGTGWLFVNSWVEPSTGMTLEITAP